VCCRLGFVVVFLLSLIVSFCLFFACLCACCISWSNTLLPLSSFAEAFHHQDSDDDHDGAKKMDTKEEDEKIETYAQLRSKVKSRTWILSLSIYVLIYLSILSRVLLPSSDCKWSVVLCSVQIGSMVTTNLIEHPKAVSGSKVTFHTARSCLCRNTTLAVDHISVCSLRVLCRSHVCDCGTVRVAECENCSSFFVTRSVTGFGKTGERSDDSADADQERAQAHSTRGAHC
jgi:hypothetical protein